METRQDAIFLWLAITIVLGFGFTALLGVVFVHPSWGDGMMGWGIGSTAVLMAIPAVLLTIFIVVILQGLMARPEHETAVSPALEVLDARYARRDLSREEYLRMRSDLDRSVQ